MAELVVELSSLMKSATPGRYSAREADNFTPIAQAIRIYLRTCHAAKPRSGTHGKDLVRISTSRQIDIEAKSRPQPGARRAVRMNPVRSLSRSSNPAASVGGLLIRLHLNQVEGDHAP